MSNLDLKEQYLMEEVEKGLDSEACLQFLIGLDPSKGNDPDNWTLDELKSAVEKFKESQKSQQETIEQIEQDSQQDQITQQEQIIPQEQQQQQQHQQQQQQQQQQQPVLVNCFQTVPNELSSDKASIKIIRYKKEDAGFFSSSYIVFQIETQPYGWTVFRRYSDFEWLRTSLQKQYPAFIIPPIHKKRSRSFEESYLTKRIIFLQRFFNSILKTFELRSNQILKIFLMCDKNSEFKKFQENVNKIPPSQSVYKMHSKEGTVNTVAPVDAYQYTHLTQEYFNEIEGIYKKVRILSKSLKEIQLQNSLKIYNVGEVFAQLFQHLNKVNQSLPIGQAQGLAATFLNLNNTMITWGNIIAKQIDQTEEYLNSFFKYQQHYNTCIRQLYETRGTIQQELERFRTKLNYKKEKLFALGDITKWELGKDFKGQTQELISNKRIAFQYMCDQETKCEIGMEKLVGYYTNQIYSQTQDYFKQQQGELVQHFIKFCQVQAFNITDHHQLWADAITNLQNNLSIKQKETQKLVVEQI